MFVVHIVRIPRRIAVTLAGAAVASLAFGGVASAATLDYLLFGSATAVDADTFQVDTTVAPNYCGADFDVSQPVDFGDITELSADYRFLQGDCALGSPRYQLNVAGGGNIFVYIGPYPNDTLCRASG